MTRRFWQDAAGLLQIAFCILALSALALTPLALVALLVWAVTR